MKWVAQTWAGFPEGFLLFCSNCLLQLPSPSYQSSHGLRSHVKHEALSQCLASVLMVCAPPPLCVSFSNSVAKKQLWLHLPHLHPGRRARMVKMRTCPPDPWLLAATHWRRFVGLCCHDSCPFTFGDPFGQTPANVTSTSHHKRKWFCCLCC